MTFPDAVRALRLKAGLTQAQLAQKMILAPSAISQYESGVRTPDAQITVRMSTALDLPPEQSIALLALAGYADEQWRERASADLEAYLEVSRDDDASAGLIPAPESTNTP